MPFFWAIRGVKEMERRLLNCPHDNLAHPRPTLFLSSPQGLRPAHLNAHTCRFGLLRILSAKNRRTLTSGNCYEKKRKEALHLLASTASLNLNIISKNYIFSLFSKTGPSLTKLKRLTRPLLPRLPRLLPLKLISTAAASKTRRLTSSTNLMV